MALDVDVTTPPSDARWRPRMRRVTSPNVCPNSDNAESAVNTPKFHRNRLLIDSICSLPRVWAAGRSSAGYGYQFDFGYAITWPFVETGLVRYVVAIANKMFEFTAALGTMERAANG